jgi:hypothetical protein
METLQSPEPAGHAPVHDAQPGEIDHMLIDKTHSWNARRLRWNSRHGTFKTNECESLTATRG